MKLTTSLVKLHFEITTIFTVKENIVRKSPQSCEVIKWYMYEVLDPHWAQSKPSHIERRPVPDSGTYVP